MAGSDDQAPDWAADLDAPASPTAPDAAISPPDASAALPEPAWAKDLPDPAQGTSASRPKGAAPRKPGATPTVAPLTVTAQKSPASQGPAPSFPDAALSAVKNFVPSTARLVGDAVNGVVHLDRTIGNIGQLGAGLISQAKGAVGVKQDPAQKAKTEALAKAVEQHYADTYGSWPGFKKALASDPASIAMDATIPLGGFGAVGKLAGLEKAAAIASRVSSTIDPLANAGRAAKIATAPIAGAARGVSGAMTGVPAHLMKVATAAGETANPALRSAFTKFYTGQGDASEFLQKAQSALGKVRQQASDAYLAKKSTLSNAAPSYQPVDDAIAAAREKTRAGGVDVGQFKQPNAALDEAESIINGWKNQAVGPYADPRFQSIAGFDNLKQAIGDLKSSYGDDVWREHLGGVYNGVKKSITDIDPEYGRLMEDYQTARANLSDLQKTIIGAGKSPGASAAMAKSLRALKTGTGKNLLGQLSAAEPELPYMLAGHALSPWGAGGQMGMFEKFAAAPAAFTTGMVTHDPVVAAAQLAAHLAAQSPKLAGAANYGAGVGLRALTKVAPPALRVGYYGGDRTGKMAPQISGPAEVSKIDLDPADVDAATRMVASEAGGEPPEGQAAALHTALNRAKANGTSLADEIAKPGAFEAVGNGNSDALDPTSAAYQRTKRDIVLPILQGRAPDPTGGAQHFINLELQEKLGRKIPEWAQGKGLRIGKHTFFPGDQVAQESDRPARATGGRVDGDRLEELVEALVRRAKSAKGAQKMETKPLLHVADDAIAKALDVAQRAI